MPAKKKDKKIQNLVIVESPAKARTIGRFLGKEYHIEASMGHVVDLPQKELGIDMENGFTPTYVVSPDKKKIVSNLKKMSKDADKVWLATDEDREGEAIAWHILNQLKLEQKDTPRIVFHEITKTALEQAIKSPRTIDMNLVDAQQGRRVLDRLVGFKVSPVLWQKVKRGLSAGRVQSVAVKILIEREKEIKEFQPKESWKLLGDIDYKKNKFSIELDKVKSNKIEIKDKKHLSEFIKQLGLDISKFKSSKDKKTNWEILALLEKLKFDLIDVTKKDSKRTPPPPFVTSTLQQEASKRFGRGVQQVMRVAQSLYENGHITYMRTDSTNLSGLAINTAKKYIIDNRGEKYSKTRQYKTKSGNAQEAHEAIRPSYLQKDPDKIGLKGKELLLYSLIWTRTIASQMSDAVLENTTYIFSPKKAPEQEWIAKGQVIKFDGFLKLYEKSGDDKDIKLPKIKKGEEVQTEKIIGEQHFTKPPARYTEASLVKKLEAEGIGRPSTYAPTISTIQQRGYVIKDDKKLVPTEIAFIVTDFLEKHFTNLMDYKFTANMEKSLDKIAEGKQDWHKMILGFYDKFSDNLAKAEKGDKIQPKVGKKCPDCGGELIYKFGRAGKFIACENYPECKYTDQSQEEKDTLKELKEKYEGEPCPEGGTVVVKMGRFGPFLASSEYPKVKWIKPIPDEHLEELEKQHGGGKCDKCGEGTMHVKKSKRGYFLACDKYPKCKNAKNIKK